MQTTLTVKVDGSQAESGANRVTNATERMERSGNSATKSMSRLTSTLKRYAAIGGTLLFAGLTAGAVQAGQEVERLNRLLDPSQMRFVREESERLGLDLLVSANGMAKLTAAAAGTELQGKKTRDIFQGLNTAVTALSLSADQSNGALRAFEQIISKGTVQAEELRGQLGERIPGAFQIAARAMGLTTQQLNKQLELGKVLSVDFLPKFAKELENTYSGKALSGSKAFTAELNRFKNAWFELRVALAEAGILDAVSNGLRSITSVLSDPAVIQGAKNLGSAIATLLAHLDKLFIVLASGAGLLLFTKALALLSPVVIAATASISKFGIGLTLLNARLAAGEIATKIFTGSLLGANTAALSAAGGIAILKAGVFSLFALVAGFQIGKYLSEEFLKVRLAGIALVTGLMKLFERLKFRATVVFEGLKFAFIKALNAMTSPLRFFLEQASKAFSALGMDEFSRQVDGAVSFIEIGSSSTREFATRINQLSAASKEAVKNIDELGSDMFAYEIAASKAAKSTEKLAQTQSKLSKVANTSIEPKKPKRDRERERLQDDFNGIQQGSSEGASLEAEYQKRLDIINRAEAAELESLRPFRELRLEQENQYLSDLFALQGEWARKEVALKNATAEQKRNIALSEGRGALSIIANFSKKAFKANQAVSLAEAAINTYQGITSALRLPFPANLGAAAKVAAVGYAQIRKIKGTSIGSNASTGGIGGGSSQQSQQPEQVPVSPQQSSESGKVQVDINIGDGAILGNDLAEIIGENVGNILRNNGNFGGFEITATAV